MVTVSSAEQKAARAAARRAEREPVRTQCRERRISQDKIAAEAGVTRPAVVLWFAGKFDSDKIAAAITRLVARAPQRRRKSAA